MTDETPRDAVPRAVQACHELLAWLIPQLDLFPRARRFTLGERLESGLLRVLEALVEAAYSREKRAALATANRTLEVERHLWRLAHELRVIPFNRYEHGARLMDDLGRQIGGWLLPHGGRLMKRLQNLWPQLIAFDNLWQAWRLARRGKSRSAGAVAFELNLERELLALHRELTDGSYQPGAYRLFTLYERKPRLIAAAPFRDRVVHHAVMNVIEPPLDRSFIFDSYACRRGKGTHAAVGRYQRWAQRYPYVLKLDIQRYFPSIDHALLKAKLRRRIADPNVLTLLDRIIDGSPDQVAGDPIYFPDDDLLTPLERRRGIPIGNLTSQFFANLYLDDLDHWLKEQRRVPAYLRYVDDLALLADAKPELHDHHAALAEFLNRERLRLHPRKAQVSRTRDGLNLLGYVVFPCRRRLRNDNGLRFRRRLRQFARAYAQGRLSLADIDPSVQAWLGHARHADTFGLRQSIFDAIPFVRGAGR